MRACVHACMRACVHACMRATFLTLPFVFLGLSWALYATNGHLDPVSQPEELINAGASDLGLAADSRDGCTLLWNQADSTKFGCLSPNCSISCEMKNSSGVPGLPTSAILTWCQCPGTTLSPWPCSAAIVTDSDGQSIFQYMVCWNNACFSGECVIAESTYPFTQGWDTCICQ